jgi:hypothetical protein
MKTNRSRLAATTAALAFFLASAVAQADSFAVRSVSYSEAAKFNGIALNLEGDVSVTLEARALVLNPKNGRHEGPGVIEVNRVNPDGSVTLLARDILADFSVVFSPSGGTDPCAGQFASSVLVAGTALGSGEHVALSAEGALVTGGGLCAETRYLGTVEIGQGQGVIRKSWGSIKVGRG